MSIPFQKLPSLVQLEVLKQLELQEAFLLSLCSEKMKRVVQCLNMKPATVQYIFLDDGVIVIAKNDYENEDIFYPIANVEFVPTIPNDEIKPMKLGGNTISCRCIKEDAEHGFFHALHYLAPEVVTVLESLQNHMKGLFRFDTRVQLLFNSHQYVNMCRIINDVTDTAFDVEELDTEELENYLTIHPGQDSLHLRAKFTGPLLTNDSKLCSIRGLAVRGMRNGGVIDPIETRQNPRLQLSEVINNFGGENLYLINVVYDVNDWAQLIRRWKSKQANQNLKFVSTTAPTGVSIPFEHTMQQFDFVEWDGERRPGTVTLDPKIIDFQLNSAAKDMDCSEWMDIQQDEDGKWASIMLFETVIWFVVWD